MSHRLTVFGPLGENLSVVAAGSGPPLILLHGFPLDHRLWQQQLEGLSSRYHVIAPEFRGFGASSLPSPEYTLADLADDVELVRRHLADGQRIILCGLSMGGYVAWEYWSRHAAHLAGLIFANTKPEADSDEGRQARLEMAKLAQARGTPAAVEDMLSKLLPESTHPSEQLRESVRSMMFDVAPASVAAAQQAMAHRRDFRSQLGDIRVPCLVVTGSEDPIAPPEATCQWAAHLPSAQCHVVEGAGHLTPLQSPEEFNSVVVPFGESCRF